MTKLITAIIFLTLMGCGEAEKTPVDKWQEGLKQEIKRLETDGIEIEQTIYYPSSNPNWVRVRTCIYTWSSRGINLAFYTVGGTTSDLADYMANEQMKEAYERIVDIELYTKRLPIKITINDERIVKNQDTISITIPPPDDTLYFLQKDSLGNWDTIEIKIQGEGK